MLASRPSVRSDQRFTPTVRGAADDSPAWVSWVTVGIVVGGIYLVAKTSPMSQGEWNELYGRRK